MTIRSDALSWLSERIDPGTRAFYHLRVPASFFLEHLDAFAAINDSRSVLARTSDDGLTLLVYRYSSTARPL